MPRRRDGSRALEAGDPPGTLVRGVSVYGGVAVPGSLLLCDRRLDSITTVVVSVCKGGELCLAPFCCVTQETWQRHNSRGVSVYGGRTVPGSLLLCDTGDLAASQQSWCQCLWGGCCAWLPSVV